MEGGGHLLLTVARKWRPPPPCLVLASNLFINSLNNFTGSSEQVTNHQETFFILHTFKVFQN